MCSLSQYDWDCNDPSEFFSSSFSRGYYFVGVVLTLELPLRYIYQKIRWYQWGRLLPVAVLFRLLRLSRWEPGFCHYIRKYCGLVPYISFRLVLTHSRSFRFSGHNFQRTTFKFISLFKLDLLSVLAGILTSIQPGIYQKEQLIFNIFLYCNKMTELIVLQ